MNVGDTFIWFMRNRREHLYIVLTDPSENCDNFVAVNITNSIHGDKSFVLRPGDHPYIVKDSDVNFGDAIIMDSRKYLQFVHWGVAIPHQPMNIAIVEKIAKALAEHPAPSGNVIALVKAHWQI